MLIDVSSPVYVQLGNSFASRKLAIDVDQNAVQQMQWKIWPKVHLNLDCSIKHAFEAFLPEPQLLCFRNLISKLLLSDPSSRLRPWGVGAEYLRIRLSLMLKRALHGFIWVHIIEKHLSTDQKRHSVDPAWFFMLEQLPTLVKSKSWKRKRSYVVASTAVFLE